MSKPSRSSEKIATAFDDWLKAEVITSGEGRNKYLDAVAESPEEAWRKFEDIKRRLALPFGNNENWNARKHDGHVQQRVPTWVELFEQTTGQPNADYYAAQAEFAPLMTTSGSYRIQCYIASKTPEEYIAMRSEGIGIDIEEAVAEQLKERDATQGFTDADISFNGLKLAFNCAYIQTELYFREMIARLKNGNDESRPDSFSTKAMKKSQTNHIQLATDCVIMAAKLRRGELEAVPFLEPKSISDQSGSVYYPLAARINWAEVLAT